MALRVLLHNGSYLSDNYRRFEFGTLNGSNVVICVTGPGKVNAAMTTQRLFDNFHVTECLLSGVAGSISGSKIGDVVVADSVLYHDYGSYEASGISPFPVTVKFPPDEIRERDEKFNADTDWNRLIKSSVSAKDLPALPRVVGYPEIM